jgi:hypothetical protein
VIPQQPDSFYAQIERENSLFDGRRAVISRDLAAGTLDVRQAVTEWIRVTTEHLAALELLRQMHRSDAGRSR